MDIVNINGINSAIATMKQFNGSYYSQGKVIYSIRKVFQMW